MLRQVASSAAQVRSALQATEETDFGELVAAGRPRAIVVSGMGGSGIAGDVLAAVCGTGCPVQIMAVHGYQLPGWVSAADLVIAVSCSGSTEETLAAAEDAVRRGLPAGRRGRHRARRWRAWPSRRAPRSCRFARPACPARRCGGCRSR